jgi:predicted phage terminase large subunit-like protein
MTATLPRLSVETFDWQSHVLRHGKHLLSTPETRRILTREDPLLWAWLYFRHHLSSPETGGRISFSQFHLDLCESALQWARKDLGPAEVREAWVAPRGSGKSTWMFGILPAWALAHGHRRFIAAFADTGHQAQQHLASLKLEFDGNQRLREDFPELCTPGRRPSGTNVADNQGLYVAQSGAVFQARGIDSSTLGAKFGTQRPDLLLHDDIEPDQSNYSLYQKAKRLASVTGAVFGMNPNAVVQFVGTTTMYGSIMHDLVKSALGHPAPDWVRDEGIRTRYYPAIINNDDGSRRSLWPERWPLSYLASIEHTRAFRLNFLNDPMGAEGDYWSPEDFRYPETDQDVDPTPRMMLSIDPAVTSKATSDYTGLAVVSHFPGRQRCTVHEAVQVKLTPAALRQKVLAMLDEWPQVGLVLVEDNQGKDVWEQILHTLPVKLRRVHQSDSKEVRAARVLNFYQRGRVIHAKPLRELEEQMCAFPKAPHDDMLDSVVSAVERFLNPPKQQQPPNAARASYL